MMVLNTVSIKIKEEIIINILLLLIKNIITCGIVEITKMFALTILHIKTIL